MGNKCCKGDETVDPGLLQTGTMGKTQISNDSTYVLPNMQEIKKLINKKTNDMDLDITRSARSSNSEDLSLLLPACKDISPTLITKYYLVYSFYMAKYNEKNSNKRDHQKLFY